jgi:phage-related tail fiber protein
MAEAVVTLAARKKILRARAGEISLAKIKGFAFGDGGVDASGNVIMPGTEQTSLNNELLRKDIDGYLMLSDTQCRYECTLACSDLVGEDISEIAVFDEDGDLISIKNFKPKGKDGDLEMTFQIDDIF